MLDLISEASALGTLLEQTRGVIGVVLGTPEGELRTVVGSFVDGDATAATAAAVTAELGKIGALLGLGDLGVASLKAASAARVFARQADAVLAIELDPRRPLGELESKLQNVGWATSPDRLESPMVNRVPTVPNRERAVRASSPPPPAVPGDPPDGAAAGAAPTSHGPSPASIPANALPIASVRPRPASSTRPPPPPPGPAMRPAASRPPPLPGGMAARPPAGLSPPRTKPPTQPIDSRPPMPPASARPPSPATILPAQVKTVGAGPVFTGDLEEFCLPDLLEFLRNSHRSGLLRCTTSAGVGTIQLSRGMIIGADSPNALDLREHLLTSAERTPERQRALAALPAEYFEDDMIDGALGSRDLVPPDEMEQARVLRIYSAFREMMRWTVGRFSFDPGVAVATNPALALSAQTILMHIYQEQDEKVR